MNWFYKLISTTPNKAVAIIRIGLGLMFLPIGYMKASNWMQTVEMMSGVTSPVIVHLVIIAELIGAILLIIGLVSRFVAASYIVIMIGAISLVHWQQGYFGLAGGGYMIHVAFIVMSLAILIAGSGSWSVDRCIATKCASSNPTVM